MTVVLTVCPRPVHDPKFLVPDSAAPQLIEGHFHQCARCRNKPECARLCSWCRFVKSGKTDGRVPPRWVNGQFHECSQCGKKPGAALLCFWCLFVREREPRS